MITENKLIEESFFKFIESLERGSIKHFKGFFKCFKEDLLSINLLCSLSKIELNETRKIYAIPGGSNLRKLDLSKLIEAYIKNNLHSIFKEIITINELEFLKSILSNGGITEYSNKEHNINTIKALKTLCLAYPIEILGKNYIVIPEDLREALLAVLEDSIIINMCRDNSLRLEMLKKLLEIYGIVPLDMAITNISKTMETESSLFLNFINKFSKRYVIFKYNKENVIHFRVIDEDLLLSEQSLNIDTPYFPVELSPHTDLSQDYEYNMYWNSYQYDFYNYLKNLLNSFQSSEELSREIVAACTYGVKNHIKLNNIINYLMLKLVFNSEKQLIKLIPYINSLYSSCNIWPTKGNNSKSLTTKKQLPMVSTIKIGRNDPCTCGSGKKYKKCCGQA